MADLDEDQWDLGGLIIGRGQPVAVDDFELGDAGARLGDVDVAGGEGVVPGYDFHGGRTLSLTVFTDEVDAASAQTAWRSLESLWRQHDLRYTPRAVVPLRIRVADRPTVRVYGRPRRFSPVGLRSLPDGAVGAVATFDVMHTDYLSDEEQIVTLSLVTTGDGGITWPIASWPITWAAGGERQDAAFNAGDMGAWPLITINGPITNPQVALVGTSISIRIVDTIPDGQSVTMDPRPWSRSITSNDGASLAGKARGSRLEDLRLPPGQTIIHFSGTDLTGTSSCTIRHRHAYSTP